MSAHPLQRKAPVSLYARALRRSTSTALELAASGAGATLVTRALIDALGYRERLTTAPLEPPLFEACGFIRRRNGRPSPATRALMALAETH